MCAVKDTTQLMEIPVPVVHAFQNITPNIRDT